MNRREAHIRMDNLRKRLLIEKEIKTFHWDFHGRDVRYRFVMRDGSVHKGTTKGVLDD